MNRRALANLDAEAEWAGRRPRLSEAAREAAGVLGGLLRALLDEGDELVVSPAPAARPLWPAIEGLPPVRMTVRSDGPFHLAWAETERAQRCGRPRAAPPVEESRRARLLGAPRAAWPIARRVNDRLFALELERRLGRPTAGTVVRTAEEALAFARDRRTAEDAAAVRLKARFSAAGRGVLRVEPEADLDRVRRFLDRHGPAVAEVEHRRSEDFGIVGIVDEEEVTLFDPHRLLVDGRGRFAGVEVPLAVTSRPARPFERVEIEQVGRWVGEQLRAGGFRGPFGLDAYRYRTASGEEALRPLVEINGRFTMAHVAWVLSERLRAPEGADRLALRIGPSPPPPGRTVLAASGLRGGTAAWIEWGRREPSVGGAREERSPLGGR